jgi:conjugal transfer pilus assembly protein TraB
MLFRLISEGELPNHAHSHLKDCVVTAAVVGDISSERGHVRLERLSCTFARGEVVEQTVEGTVFALDAKNGVRGRPLWREGALLARATLAGTLSGLAGSLSSMSLTGTKASTPALDSTLLKGGGVQGASSAMEKLAEYNIQRAEQYHPVIQLSAGQIVDVLFLKGFYLDGRSHSEATTNADSPPTLFEEESTDSTGLTLSPAQIEKIKQHEAALGWAAGKTEAHDSTEGEAP